MQPNCTPNSPNKTKTSHEIFDEKKVKHPMSDLMGSNSLFSVLSNVGKRGNEELVGNNLTEKQMK